MTDFADSFRHYTRSAGGPDPDKYHISTGFDAPFSGTMWTSGVTADGSGEAHFPTTAERIHIPSENGRSSDVAFFYRTGLPAFPSGEHVLVAWYTQAGGDRWATLQCSVKVTSTGTIQLYRGATLLGSSAPGVLVAGADPMHIEVAYNRQSSGGALSVAVQGVQVIAVAGNTQTVDPGGFNFTFAQLGTGSGSLAIDDYFSHLLIYGVASYQGPRRIDVLYTTGSGPFSEWTPNSGADWQAVGEQFEDRSTYIDSITSYAPPAKRAYFTWQPYTEVYPITGVHLVAAVQRTNHAPDFDLQLDFGYMDGGVQHDVSLGGYGWDGNDPIAIAFPIAAPGGTWTPAVLNRLNFGVALSSTRDPEPGSARVYQYVLEVVREAGLLGQGAQPVMMDSFDFYDTAEIGARGYWAAVFPTADILPTIVPTAGRRGTQAMYFADSTHGARWNHSQRGSFMYSFSLYLDIATLPATPFWLVRAYSQPSLFPFEGGGLEVQPDGSIKLWRHIFGTKVLVSQTGPGVILPRTVQYVQWAENVADSSYAHGYEVKVGGTTFLLDWINPTLDTDLVYGPLLFGLDRNTLANVTINAYIDDLLMQVPTGFYNNFYPDEPVSALYVCKAGFHKDWVGSARAVREVIIDGDLSYISTATPGTYDSFTMQQVNASGEDPIRAAQFNWVPKVNATTVRPFIRNTLGDWDILIGQVAVSEPYPIHRSLYDYDRMVGTPAPHTGWPVSVLNSLEYGVYTDAFTSSEERVTLLVLEVLGLPGGPCSGGKRRPVQWLHTPH